jgi:hypothetical protein
MVGSGFPPPYHFQTLERQILIDLVNHSQHGCDLPRLPAGGYDCCLITRLGDYTL